MRSSMLDSVALLNYSHKENSMYKNILVPTDGSELSEKAVKEAIGLAKSLGASLTFLNVTGEYPYVAFEEASPHIPASVKKGYYEEAAAHSAKLLDHAKRAAT